MIGIVYDKNRELSELELINLKNKKNTVPVEYFRKNLFNATTRESRELNRKKTIFDDGKNKIQVNRSLHQRHRDLLSLIFLDNIKVSEPNKDGSYYIHVSLYNLSKKMGYSPLQGINKVVKYIEDLHSTLMTVDIKQEGEIRHTLIGDSYYDKYKSKEFIIEIPSLTAKYHILNFSVEIPREINRKIIQIPNKYAKTKALISYLLSNQALKNGISFENVCDKLDIVKENKSRFKKELKENTELLAEFNIFFNQETNIIKYEQICDIKFHRAIKPDEIVEIIEQEQIDPKEQALKEMIEQFQNKFIKSPAKMGGGFVTYKIIEIEQEEKEEELLYRFFLGVNVKKGKMYADWNTKEYFIKLLEQDWIVENEIFS